MIVVISGGKVRGLPLSIHNVNIVKDNFSVSQEYDNHLLISNQSDALTGLVNLEFKIIIILDP